MRAAVYSLAMVIAATLLTACAGSNSHKATEAGTPQEAQPTPIATQVAEPTIEGEAISLLRQHLEAQGSVHTVRGRMVSEMKTGGMTTTADYEFELPDRIHMELKVGSTHLEGVMTDGRMFVKLSNGRWMEPPEGMLTFDIHSMMGMPSTSEPDLGLYENLKVEEGGVIDGVETVHISFEMDMQKSMEQASETSGQDFSELLGQASETLDLSQKTHEDIWIGKEDKLQRRVETRMALADGGEMKITMDFFAYGEPMDIPSLEEMLEKTGG